MAGHLCLKWNNHSSAFIRSINSIQIKERYCDATIICQGKYYPVHRIILSTCSEYFDEIFATIQCQHPYIVFKDIEPKEMGLLLNYMYQGEVNVLQEMLPSLIKAAEALQIKGLAVPDDIPSIKKRGSSTTDTPQPKRRSEERKRRNSSDLVSQAKNANSQKFSSETNASDISNNAPNTDVLAHFVDEKEMQIKEEPPESADFSSPSTDFPDHLKTEAKEIPFYSTSGDSEHHAKDAPPGSSMAVYEEQSASWTDFNSANEESSQPMAEVFSQEDIIATNPGGSQEQASNHSFRIETISRQNRPGPQTGTVATRHCPYCSYSSLRSSDVKMHIMFKHTGERPFPCTLCSKRFVQKVDLRRHMTKHTEEAPFQCGICLRRFKERRSLKPHLVKVHRIKA